MGQRFRLEKLDKKPHNLLLVISTVAILGTGLAMLLSSSFYRGMILFQDPFRFFKNQVVFAGVGLGLAYGISRIPVDFIRKSVPFLLVGSYLSLLLVFVPGIGLTLMGATRWLNLGFTSIQPSEFVKITMVLYLAFILSKKQDQLNDLGNTLLPPFLAAAGFVFLVVIQNDFSSAIFMAVMAMLMFFIAGVRMMYFTALVTITLPLGLLALLTEEYRVQRIITFIAPHRDPTGAGFQVLSSQQALASGGFWGRGIGQGVRKLGNLPEAYSDFVFAVVGEEAGFIGVLGVVVLFAVFAVAGYRIAMSRGVSFTGFAAFGLTSLILFQSLTNFAVVVGLIPATGIPLPFFSSGGSSLLSTLIIVGLLGAFSRQGDSTLEAENG
ncbi:putative lipid II flippase FtsW [Spirochaeta lutea]|uniref:Probable peptidoglycan glycosyltransferase FtsW n=1 Tax=Spirochaeta lutea TaxID=1480694 RepID=A0A098R036_9SPIO|nr:putative lipid II flippase FtsW [Spirochaeta lutea]KGE73510.1 hypothetical protein DC28_02255 [Spirochaeta lutea]